MKSLIFFFFGYVLNLFKWMRRTRGGRAMNTCFFALALLAQFEQLYASASSSDAKNLVRHSFKVGVAGSIARERSKKGSKVRDISPHFAH